MGIVSLVSTPEVVLWERPECVVLFADADVQTRRHLAPVSAAQPVQAGQSGK